MKTQKKTDFTTLTLFYMLDALITHSFLVQNETMIGISSIFKYYLFFYFDHD